MRAFATGVLGFAALAVLASSFWPGHVLPCSTSGPYRVATYGTSLTALGGWQDRLQEQLSKRMGRPVTVANYGIDGNASGLPKGDESFREMKKARFDAVTIELAVNDAWRYTPDQSREKTIQVIKAVQRSSKCTTVYLMTTNPVYNDKARPNLQAYFAQYQEIARETGAKLIDLEPVWRAAAASNQPAMIPDGIHPTAEAYDAVLPAMAAALAR